MGQGSASAAENALANAEFWFNYLDFERRWAELEKEDSDFIDYDDDDPF